MKVHVQQKHGVIKDLYIAPSHTIWHVKQNIKGGTGLSPSMQRIFYRARELHNNRSVGSYDIRNKSNLYLILTNRTL